MFLSYTIILYLITLVGGTIPLWLKRWNNKASSLLLAFSGTFLLGITLTHLIPENLHHNGNYASIFICIGFLLQFILQKLTHGLEHGHVHVHGHHIPSVQWSLMLGLGIHAFSEGIPLGIVYHDSKILPSLFFAIALHKLPESMLLTSILLQTNYSRTKTFLIISLFSLITPIAILLTKWLELKVGIFQNVLVWCLPFVVGSFLQISTTVLYESGTKHHEIKLSKWVAIILGFAIAIFSTFFLSTHHH
jgi:zinc and cadmium transporter